MGRRFKLTPERAERICKAVADAHTYAYAAAAAGIGERTLYRYMSEGDEALMRFENGEELTEPDALLAQFAMMLSEAQQVAEERLLGRIEKASETQWQAAAWILERRWPRDWSRSAKVRTEEERIIHVEMNLNPPEKALALADLPQGQIAAAPDIIEATVLDEENVA